jgi:hypothetical protein
MRGTTVAIEVGLYTAAAVFDPEASNPEDLRRLVGWGCEGSPHRHGVAPRVRASGSGGTDAPAPHAPGMWEDSL